MTELLPRIQKLKKYQYLPDSVILRALAWAEKREKKPRNIEKLARKKLHQIYGAYLAEFDQKRFQEALDRQDTESLLKLHSSTAERYPILDTFYSAIFEQTGPVKQILDLACGLNPLTYPFFKTQCEGYTGLDLDSRLAEALEGYFPETQWRVGVADLLAKGAWPEADMVWLFKTLPCLEQQDKGSAQRLLQSLDAPWLVVSYPTQTLGGKNKGMAENYSQQLDALLPDTPYNVSTTLSFYNEWVVVLTRY